MVLVVPGQRPGGRVALLALLGAHLDAGEGEAAADGRGGGGGARWGAACGILPLISSQPSHCSEHDTLKHRQFYTNTA